MSGPDRVHRPPRGARLIVTATAHRLQREAQLGDLEEEYRERAARNGAEARRWYWRQALASVGPNLAHRARYARARTRDRRGGEGIMQTLVQDIRRALRGARRYPAFTAVVVLTLALGIGATTTIFSAVYGLVLHPFPFPDPGRIVGVGTTFPKLGSELSFWENLSPAEYVDVRDQSRTLEDVVAWDMGNRQIAGEGPPRNVFTAFWWGNALKTLGMSAYLGRGFSEEEAAKGDAVALLSYRLWRDRFGADSSMVGSKILVNGYPYTLVGILPPGVEIYGTDLWTTMVRRPEAYPRNRRQFQLMARIRPGSTLRQVNTELAGLARRTEQDHGSELPEYHGWSMTAMTWNDVASRPFRAGAFVLLGAVGFVLLLVCANTANLLLARAQVRRREMAVRTTLGAGRGRLLTQLLVESLTLSILGGLGGLAVAWLGIEGIRALLTTLALPVAGTVSLSAPVLGFTAAVAVAAGVVFGVAPAFQASRVGIGDVLRAEGWSATAGRSRQRVQRTLVAVEVALAFVLLAGSGLLINSFIRLSGVDPGFDPHDVLTMRLTLPRQKYSSEAVPVFFRRLDERLEAIPGIRSAAAGSQFPPIAFSYGEVRLEDAAASNDDATLPRALVTVVTPGYFRTLQVPVVVGRTFNDEDRADAPPVAVVNEAAARRWFGTSNPVGKRLKLGKPGSDARWTRIVGVVGSTRNRGLDRDPQPEIFEPHEQVGGVANQLFLLLRTSVPPGSVLPAVRRAIRAMDADQPVYAIETADQAFARAAATRRSTTLFLTVFGLFALVLAAAGIYSVVSFTVSERTREIGLRVALGAAAPRVRRLMVRQSLIPVLAGAVAGAGLAVLVGGTLRRLLFQVRGNDPLTLGCVALLLVGVAVAASFVPAWRASRVDPVEALRTE